MTASPARLPGPSGLAQLPFLRRMFVDPQPVLDELQAEFGGVIGLGAGPMRLAVVGDPTALTELFAAPSESFRWGHKFNVLEFVVGEGSLIVADGSEHERLRASVQAAFSRRRLNGWIPTIVAQTDLEIDELMHMRDDPAAQVDLYPFARRLVLGVVVRALFGESLASRAAEIGELFQRPQDYLESPAIRQIPHRLPFTKRARVRADRRALDEIINGAIAERRANPSGDPLDVLEVLVQEGGLSDAEIRDQVVTLIGAGYDTTSASLSWMLWRAALDRGVWQDLRAEADTVFGSLGTEAPTPDHATLSRLHVADGVMRETLRLNPAGVISPREAAVDVRLGDHVIRKGTLILWSAYLAGRDAETWSDPLRFDPGRFRDPTPAQKSLASTAWVPFGRGARNCIGFMLAQMELTLMISRLAQRLDLQPIADEVPRPVGMVVNRPSGGVPMIVTAR